MGKTNLEKRKINCSVCDKEFTTEQWVEEEGILKGQKIIKTTFCSDKCKKKFDKLIKEIDDK